MTASPPMAAREWTGPLTVQGAGGSLRDRFLHALDPRRMGPGLATALGAGPASCHVLDAKLEPRGRATVLYAHGPRLVRGDLIMEGDPAGVADEPTAAPGVRLHVFPADPDLPHLSKVMSPSDLSRLLHREIQPSPRGAARGTRPRTTLLRYRAGRRATVLLRSGEDRHVAKAYHDAAKAGAVAREAQALERIPREDGVLRLAPTVAHLPELDVVVQRAVRGTPLDLLVDAPGGPLRLAREAVGAAARALAEFHEAHAVTDRPRHMDRELRRFLRRAHAIGTIDPRVGDAAGLVAERLIGAQPHLPPARPAVVHGDCKPSQFLVSGDRVYLLDLDHVGEADQAGDIGTFLATLRQMGLRRAAGDLRRRAALAELGDVFVETYLVHTSGCQDLARIRWQEAVALERKALRAFARAPGSPLALSLIREADRCLDTLGEPA